MTQSIRSFLKRSYPFPSTMVDKLVHASIGGTVITAILFFMQPFNLEDVQSLKELFIVGFGIITFLIVYLGYSAPPLLFPESFNSQNWTVARQIQLLISTILILSLSNWTYSYLWIGDTHPFPSLPRFVFITTVLSFPPSLIGILFNDILRRKSKNSKS